MPGLRSLVVIAADVYKFKRLKSRRRYAEDTYMNIVDHDSLGCADAPLTKVANFNVGHITGQPETSWIPRIIRTVPAAPFLTTVATLDTACAD